MRVLVIGGGAAGMMAALTAAENGHAVTLLERQGRVGRKLMATGNGRCNLTNHHVSPAHSHGGEGLTVTLDLLPDWGCSPRQRTAGGYIPSATWPAACWMCCGSRWKTTELTCIPPVR